VIAVGALCALAFLGAPVRRDDVDALRSQARRQVAAAYGRTLAHGRRFAEQAALYDRTCRTVTPVPRACRAQQVRLRAEATALAGQMEAAEEIARRGWLEPGEAREIARRQGLDEALPQQIARVMAEPAPSVPERETKISRRRPRRRGGSAPRP
jgi:hypothetical protein